MNKKRIVMFGLLLLAVLIAAVVILGGNGKGLVERNGIIRYYQEDGTLLPGSIFR